MKDRVAAGMQHSLTQGDFASDIGELRTGPNHVQARDIEQGMTHDTLLRNAEAVVGAEHATLYVATAPCNWRSPRFARHAVAWLNQWPDE
jgi:hypothetical protein